MPAVAVSPHLRAALLGSVAVAVAVLAAGCSGGSVSGPAASVSPSSAAGAPSVGLLPSPSRAVSAAVSAAGAGLDVSGRGGEPATGAAASTVRASAVLHRWDRARARAYASGDPAALRRLYVHGSTAGTADVRTLRAYRSRGLRVEGMRMQLLAVRVLEERPRRMRLEVTDRLFGATAVGPRGRLRLPSDVASTRVLLLVRGDAGWQVAEVSDPGPRRAGPRAWGG